ncbi:MAG: hypothetical protein AAF526_04760 [Pseudomonadota bacterium]
MRFARSALMATAAAVIGQPATAVVIASGSFNPPDVETAATTSNVQVGGASGSSDNGSLEINGGSFVRTVNPSPFGNIAQGAGSTGAVTVTGSGSEWRLEGRDPEGFGAFLTIGRNGTGTLDIENGGRVTVSDLDGLSNRPANDDYAGFQVGRNAGSAGTVNITGAGSELLIDSAFGTGFIGRRETGTMNIMNGGQLTFSGINTDLNVASDLGSTTTARGELNISNGGQALGATFMDIGGQPGAVGTVNVDGSGSTISLSGSCVAPCPDTFSSLGQGAFMTIGANEGVGFVNVTNGGEISIDSTSSPGAEFPGFNLGGSSILGPMGSGTMTVDGPGSAVRVTGDRPFFSVGRLENGAGALNILNGGQVTLADTVANGNGSIGFVGDRPGANGRILIDGPDSLMDVGNFLGIGVDSRDPDVDAGDGLVTVRNGGTLKVDDIIVGAGGTINGSGTVMGSTTTNTTLVQDRGVVDVGLSIGALSFDGDLILDGGTLRLEAFGPMDLDRIDIAGDLVLRGGTIEVLLGFEPDPNEPLQFIFTDDVIIENGGVDAIVILGLAGIDIPIGSLVQIGLGDEVFEAEVSAAVPLPSPLLLLLGSLTGLAAVRGSAKVGATG